MEDLELENQTDEMIFDDEQLETSSTASPAMRSTSSASISKGPAKKRRLYQLTSDKEDAAIDATLKMLQVQSKNRMQLVAHKTATPTSTFAAYLESILKEFPTEDREEFEFDVMTQAFAKKREISRRSKLIFTIKRIKNTDHNVFADNVNVQFVEYLPNINNFQPIQNNQPIQNSQPIQNIQTISIAKPVPTAYFQQIHTSSFDEQNQLVNDLSSAQSVERDTVADNEIFISDFVNANENGVCAAKITNRRVTRSMEK